MSVSAEYGHAYRCVKRKMCHQHKDVTEGGHRHVKIGDRGIQEYYQYYRGDQYVRCDRYDRILEAVVGEYRYDRKDHAEDQEQEREYRVSHTLALIEQVDEGDEVRRHRGNRGYQGGPSHSEQSVQSGFAVIEAVHRTVWVSSFHISCKPLLSYYPLWIYFTLRGLAVSPCAVFLYLLK